MLTSMGRMFKLSSKSLLKLDGVHPDLVKVVLRAISITRQDFIVQEGLRTMETQREYVKRGVSKTMNSKHLTGDAVDLVPYINGQPRWEWEPIYDIADAVDQAATILGVKLRWGGVWDKTMDEYGGSREALKKEVQEYCKRHPGPDFLDGPHWELVV